MHASVKSIKSPAYRRYVARFLPAIFLYVTFLFVTVWIFSRYHLTGVAAYALAVLPALPILGIIVIVGMYLGEEKDEFQRNLLVQAMVWSIGATLSITTVWGFLEDFLPVSHLQPYLVFPLFWFCVGVATCVLKLRYR